MLEKQNRFKDHCQGNCEYRLLTPNDKNLLPFVLLRPVSGNPITTFYIENTVGGQYNCNIGFVNIYAGATYDYLVYFPAPGGSNVLSQQVPCGFYTAVMSDGINTWYSERFYVFDESAECHMNLTWSQDCDFTNVPYKSGFYNSFWFEHTADIGNRDHRDTIEKIENGERKPIVSFQRTVPLISIDTSMVPDYILEALKFMTLHENINLTLKYGQGSGAIENVDVKQKWLFDDCFCNVTITFDNPALLKDNCCDEDLATY
jgi:hypothetical protein